MIDGLITAIVRPIRAKYTSIELGPTRIRYGDIEYFREDFNVQNYRNLQVQGSFWSIMNKEYENNESCILYLHPNSGSRVDVVKNARIMAIAAHTKCNVCSFDFSGCGESDGDCISLGVREKEDVCAVLSYLLSKGCRRFIIWGRSMGAATALMFYGAYKELLVGTVVALILDSPFTSLQGIATEYTSTRSVPGLILAPALQYIRHNINSQYGFDIMLATPVTAAQRVNIPAIVLSGGEDKTVPPILSEEVYNALVGPKLRIHFTGSHNSKRPSCIYELLRYFLPGVLKGLPINELLVNSADILKKDIIPDKDIHGVSKDDTDPNLETTAPSEEACLLDENKISSSPLVSSFSSSTSSTSISSSTIITNNSVPTSSIGSTSHSPKQSPNSKKKHIHKSTHNNNNQTIKGNEKSNPSPWNQKEIFRENHSYGINTNNHNNIHNNNNIHTYNGLQRRNTGTAIHPHIQCHNQIHSHSNRHPHSHLETKSNHRKVTPPTIYSVTYEKVNIHTNSSKQQLAVPSEETMTTPTEVNSLDWMGVIGSLFWGSSPSPSTEISPPSPNNFQRPISYGGSPAGSLGYLLHHLESDICPPESIAWESVLLARAIEDITDAVLTQVLPLAVGLLEVSIENQKTKLNEFINYKSPSYGSQLFQQVSSDLGLVSVDPNESLMWSKLIFLSPRELFTLIQDKEQEKDQQKNNEHKNEFEHEPDDGEDENENETTTSEDKSHSCSSGNSLDEFNQQQSPISQDSVSTNYQSEEPIFKAASTPQISKPTN